MANALLQSCLAKALMKTGALAEVKLVKSLKMVAKPVGEGNTDVGGDAMCRRPKKSCENAPELISCIFQGLRLGIIASSNIYSLASLSTLKKILAFYSLQKMVSHFI
jgi:hypothetical protein